jgi:hypothetical protein
VVGSHMQMSLYLPRELSGRYEECRLTKYRCASVVDTSSFADDCIIRCRRCNGGVYSVRSFFRFRRSCRRCVCTPLAHVLTKSSPLLTQKNGTSTAVRARTMLTCHMHSQPTCPHAQHPPTSTLLTHCNTLSPDRTSSYLLRPPVVSAASLWCDIVERCTSLHNIIICVCVWQSLYERD